MHDCPNGVSSNTAAISLLYSMQDVYDLNIKGTDSCNKDDLWGTVFIVELMVVIKIMLFSVLGDLKQIKMI